MPLPWKLLRHACFSALVSAPLSALAAPPTAAVPAAPPAAAPAPAPAATAAPTPAGTTAAATPAPDASPPPATLRGTLTLETGTGRVISLSAPAENVFVADPKVAEVRPASADSLFVFGVSPGHTTVAALNNSGQVLAQYDLTVRPSTFHADEAQTAIARLLHGSNVQVTAQDKGLLLTGSVTSPQDAAQAVAIAKDYSGDNPTVDNQLTIAAPLQVTLSVRIAQMSRQVVRNLGVNWSALATFGTIAKVPAAVLNINSSGFTCGVSSGGSVPVCPGVNFGGVIDALAKDNLAHVLAEPNLTVLSGQPASFQVGGEYPIPVSQQGTQVSISYKNFGVILNFLPTVMSDGRINLHVAPEVSELSSQNSVALTTGFSTLVVPSLTVRRAETTVELGSGQSLAIAGMLEQETTDNGLGLPGLGDLPIVGSLFHDNQFTRTETELVIVVTPYIVRPVNTLADLHLPTDTYNSPTDIQRLLFMRQVAQNQPPVPVRIPGDAGFIVQ